MIIDNKEYKEVKHGFWKHVYDEDGEIFFKRRWYCSACNDWNSYGTPAFCPNCGATMDLTEVSDNDG